MQQTTMSITTPGRGLSDITAQLNTILARQAVVDGLCHVFLQHTSASLIICENADSQVLRDLEAFTQRLIPDGDPLFKHTDEGPDDMPAHIRTILTQSALLIPIRQSQLALGSWQGAFLWEHRYQGHQRHIIISIF
jgi:secondary thiamine-phosphate synthase enzyme